MSPYDPRTPDESSASDESLTSRTALVLRHIAFEDLGSFAAPLAAAGYRVRYHDIGVHDLAHVDACADDLLIVLGAPVGVYEDDRYPFLADECALLQRRLDAGLPTLGICLGAQLIARALGARVYPSGIKEIGWAPVTLSDAAATGPFRHLAGVPVLHWHGDTFDLPSGAMHLASTGACMNQAFAIGVHVLGVQFHPEVDATLGIERWLIGHAAEIANAGIDPRDLRQATSVIGAAPREASQSMLAEWLTTIAQTSR